MKKIFLILFYMLIFINCKSINVEVKDTSKNENFQFDLKPEIAKQLRECSLSSNFDGLIKFLDSRVDFMLIGLNNDVVQECMTDYAVVENLNSLFQNINYSYFKIMSGINADSETVFTIQLLVKKNDYEYVIRISFILGNNKSIQTVAIY